MLQVRRSYTRLICSYLTRSLVDSPAKIARDRVTCMERNGSSAPLSAIDLCLDDAREGTDGVISRNDPTSPHLPTHRTFKSGKVLL